VQAEESHQAVAAPPAPGESASVKSASTELQKTTTPASSEEAELSNGTYEDQKSVVKIPNVTRDNLSGDFTAAPREKTLATTEAVALYARKPNDGETENQDDSENEKPLESHDEGLSNKDVETVETPEPTRISTHAGEEGGTGFQGGWSPGRRIPGLSG
jgi:hypothetical protein